LRLDYSTITDDGLEHLTAIPDFMYLYLGHTQVGDTGLKKLKTLTGVKELWLEGSKATAAGVDDLHKAIPGCSILWDGPTAQPTADHDRLAARWVVSIGGTVRTYFNGQIESTRKAGGLPKGGYYVLGIDLSNNPKATDDGLRSVRGRKELSEIKLSNTPVTKAAVEELHKAQPGCRIEWDGGTVEP